MGHEKIRPWDAALPIRPFLILLFVAATFPVSAHEVSTVGGSAIPIPTLPIDFDDSTFGAANTVTSVTAAACPGLTSVPGGEVVYTFRTGNGGIGNHIDFDLTPQPGFGAVIYVLATEGDGATCVASQTTLLPNGMVRLHVQETLVPNHDYYAYVDSPAGGGDFHLFAWVFIGVELQTFSID